jgi:hypothetical protein
MAAAAPAPMQYCLKIKGDNNRRLHLIKVGYYWVCYYTTQSPACALDLRNVFIGSSDAFNYFDFSSFAKNFHNLNHRDFVDAEEATLFYLAAKINGCKEEFVNTEHNIQEVKFFFESLLSMRREQAMELQRLKEEHMRAMERHGK